MTGLVGTDSNDSRWKAHVYADLKDGGWWAEVVTNSGYQEQRAYCWTKRGARREAARMLRRYRRGEQREVIS